MRIKLGLFTSMILVAFFVFVSSGYAIDKNAILGIWVFDEQGGNVAKDSSGNGRDGEILAGVDWVDGKSGGALSFPGDGSRVSIPHDDELTLTTFSITAWIKCDVAQSFQTILGKGDMSTNYSYYLMLWQEGQKFNFVEFATTGQEGWTSCQGKTPVWDGVWHHLAGTYDGEIMRLYIDGILDAELTTSDAPFECDDPLGIGAMGRGSDPYIGIIDEVGLFSVGLSEEEVKSIMNDGIIAATDLAAVSPADKTAATWGRLKSNT